MVYGLHVLCLHPKKITFRLPRSVASLRSHMSSQKILSQAILTGCWDFEAIQHLLNLGRIRWSRSILNKVKGPKMSGSEGIW